MRVEIHHRHAVRADGSGRQVDHANAGLERAQERVVLHMCAGRRRIEHEVDLVEHGQAREPFHAFMRRRHAELAARARPSEAGSMPTIAAISRCLPPRMILIMRSVPMLPEPMIAALHRVLSVAMGMSPSVIR
jgi:hypothetical protein